jgi:5-methylcytosine-specific restriction endonuclease McrA
MPSLPHRPCRQIGCRYSTPCDVHGVRRPFAASPTSTPFYKSAAWRALRAQVLAEEPTCRACGERASVADHITARRMGGSNDRANLQGVCWPCSRSKTAREANVYRKQQPWR